MVVHQKAKKNTAQANVACADVVIVKQQKQDTI